MKNPALIAQHAKFIDDLGGPRVVGKIAGVIPNQVFNWKRLGISDKTERRVPLAAEAIRRGVELPDDFKPLLELSALRVSA
jgi:hypothetical protein